MHLRIGINVNSFINTDLIMNMFGNNKAIAAEQYLKLVNAIGDKNDKNQDNEMVKEVFKIEETQLLNKNGDDTKFKMASRKMINEIVAWHQITK